MREKEAWLRWPDRQAWDTFLRCGLWLMIEWLVVYGGANWIAGLHAYRVPLHTHVDSQIPLVPAAAIVYLSLFPMLWLSPFVLHTPQRLQSFARALALLIAISGVGFLILPGEQIDVTTNVPGAVGEIFQFADWLNLSHNYLPSLHVGMAVVCAIGYSQTAPRKLAIFFSIWAGAIALSTLLTRQHYVADVLTGGALGLFIATIFVSSWCHNLFSYGTRQ